MKIAILAPIAWRTPPRQYGPWEQVASMVAEGLIEKGVDVTLFATADSLTAGKLEACCARPYAEDTAIDPKVAECLHISHLMERSAAFDLIHNHFDFLPLTYSRLIRTPMVTTIHGFSSPKILEVYQKYNAFTRYVSISDADRSPLLDYEATVYNGLHLPDFPPGSGAGEYLLFFGRIHPDKGTCEAIRIARQAGRKLLIAGLIQDTAYFESQVKPWIDNDRVTYTGNAGPEERKELLGNALALLHPINFEEPFGLSVAESMCCGTPVIAFARGAMPELVTEGVTGFLVPDVEEAVKAVEKVAAINREACRRLAISRFSREKMVDGYLKVYEQLLAAR